MGNRQFFLFSCFIYGVKVSFLNTTFNNISFGLSRGLASKFKKGKFEGPKNDVFQKNVKAEQAEQDKDKRVSDEEKVDISTVKPWAKRLSFDADAAFKIFRTKMENTFSSVCNFENKKYDWLSSEDCKGMLVANKKSMTSIIEKMLSGRKKNEKDARAEIQDAIRARIVLTNGSKAEGDAIFNEIINAVKKGKLEVKEIRNYATDGEMQYVSSKMIKKLKQTVDDVQGGYSCDSLTKQKSTGYNAVHIIFKIDDEFDGELQIMGRDVENLKDTEDVFYKLGHNKHVSKKYTEIKKKYNALRDKNPNKLKTNLEAYTREAYLYERKKELGLVKDLYNGQFLPLDTTKYDLPKEFDFNNIAAIKNSAQ